VSREKKDLPGARRNEKKTRCCLSLLARWTKKNPKKKEKNLRADGGMNSYERNEKLRGDTVRGGGGCSPRVTGR